MTMTPSEFKKEAEKHGHKIGAKTYEEFLLKAGYSPANGGKSFYENGVSKRAIAFLEMVKKIPILKD